MMLFSSSSALSLPSDFHKFPSTPSYRHGSSRYNVRCSVAAEKNNLELQNPVAATAAATATSDPLSRFPKLPALAASLCDAADDFIDKYLDKPPKPSFDPRVVLAGNFAPVGETPPTECHRIEGALPACLNGVYIRNGPNPLFPPRGAHHLYDGDGMLHALRIRDGSVTLCSRFVYTDKLSQEAVAGRPMFAKVFSGFNGLAGVARAVLAVARTVLGIVDNAYASGLANTSILFFERKFLALGESGMPYAFKIASDGDIINTGRHDFDGRLTLGMTAHPKIDPATGELFAFRYAFPPPFLNLFRVSPNGEKHPDVPLRSMRQRPAFIHDFAVTGAYTIIPDTQIVVDPMRMVADDGSPIFCDAAKVPRLGVVPRYASDDSDMRWFDVPGLNFVHAVNAWDDKGGDEVVLVAANALPVDYVLEENHLLRFSVEMVRMNIKTGAVSRKCLSSNRCLELGVVNPRYLTKKNRYAYMSIGAPFPKACGVAKLDFSKADGDHDGAELVECVVASRVFGDNCFGGEVSFVPSGEMGEDEDDGYVMALVHDESADLSKLLVMDAKSPTLEIVAAVELPTRVPYGFHGLFVSEDKFL
uniref:Carotenoid cleavage dioxygenase 4 n=1 Tax=Araucaria cunninghamii TaxID=56994 RepID=A0A0D6R1V1_ARACU